LARGAPNVNFLGVMIDFSSTYVASSTSAILAYHQKQFVPTRMSSKSKAVEFDAAPILRVRKTSEFLGNISTNFYGTLKIFSFLG
jgi:hypothetical protein